MKENEELLLICLANNYQQDHSLIKSLVTLNNYNLISNDQLNIINDNIKKDANLDKILVHLIKNPILVEYIIFFNNHYSLDKSIIISIDIIKKIRTIKKDIINSLLYPIILIIMTTIALLFVSNYIIPQLLLINPKTVDNYRFIIITLNLIPLIVLSTIGLIVIIIITLKVLLNKYFNQTLSYLLKIPIINYLFKYYITLKFSLKIKEILKSICLSKDALIVLKRQSNDKFIDYICQDLINQLNMGNHFFEVIKNNKLLLNDFKKQLYISNNSLSMATIIDNYFNFKLEILKNKIKKIISIGVPIIISVIGFLLIMMYLLIMLPILDLSSSL
ncbi:MAG: hypothetical protein LBT75_04855 [Bacilli bacterium]|jgi:competence protein ComGB|nr:hypothetical protein [Bacilli bacterium]